MEIANLELLEASVADVTSGIMIMTPRLMSSKTEACRAILRMMQRRILSRFLSQREMQLQLLCDALHDHALHVWFVRDCMVKWC